MSTSALLCRCNATLALGFSSSLRASASPRHSLAGSVWCRTVRHAGAGLQQLPVCNHVSTAWPGWTCVERRGHGVAMQSRQQSVRSTEAHLLRVDRMRT